MCKSMCMCCGLICKIGVDGPSLRSKERKEFKTNGPGSSFRMARFHSDIADLCINHSTYAQYEVSIFDLMCMARKRKTEQMNVFPHAILSHLMLSILSTCTTSGTD